MLFAIIATLFCVNVIVMAYAISSPEHELRNSVLAVAGLTITWLLLTPWA